MNKPMDDDVKSLMEQSSLKNTLTAYGMTLAFAAVSAISAMAMREMLETISMKIIFSQQLQTTQYGGFRRISQIGALTLMVGVWLTTFMIVWHRLEKTKNRKKRVVIGLIWIGSAVAAYFLFALVQYFAVGFWPTLTGAV